MKKIILTKKINPNQLAKELEDAGLDRGFVERHSDKTNTIIFKSDDEKVVEILEAHTPDDALEKSLTLPDKTPEEIKQERINAIDGITDFTKLREYLKEKEGLADGN